jgi:hypothetical protein
MSRVAGEGSLYAFVHESSDRFLFDALIFCLLDYWFVIFVQPSIATTRREVRARRNPPSTETGRV